MLKKKSIIIAFLYYFGIELYKKNHKTTNGAEFAGLGPLRPTIFFLSNHFKVVLSRSQFSKTTRNQTRSNFF